MYNHYLFNVIKFNNSCNSSNDEKGNTKIKYMCKLEHKFFNIQLCNILNIINHCGSKVVLVRVVRWVKTRQVLGVQINMVVHS